MGDCMCSGSNVIVLPCSGGSDVGELTDRAARSMARKGFAKMFCLAGIGAHIDGMIASAKGADKVIAIDGCPVRCAHRVLEHAGI